MPKIEKAPQAFSNRMVNLIFPPCGLLGLCIISLKGLSLEKVFKPWWLHLWKTQGLANNCFTITRYPVIYDLGGSLFPQSNSARTAL